ncbi:MAG: response regulator transcription factor [Sphingobacteriales bacterium]|nr:MAG: response regulator transcription factor [Sphingobacteriales bacterium]
MKTPAIAIAENHSLLRRALLELVMALGFRVIADAANGKELIRKLSFISPQPDICIVNIKKIATADIETIKELKATWPHVKILAFSFSKTDEEVDTILNSGADTFLHKGGDGNQLKKVLDELFASR